MTNWGKSEVLQYHLKELHDDLRRVLNEVSSQSVNNVALYIDFAHMYHHLNSAWNSREYTSLDNPELMRDARYFELASFPTDIDPWNPDMIPDEDGSPPMGGRDE